ncbi:MAG: hypothetical protein K0S53_2005 [Bacteroidetes bacterium]|jgi:tetratricopeptide (TPR) repeat protein|nr:hypothetical protein [Bacteroidota bacterium]MDF2451071.1 hypothetical protein [Bacteroidota bacterium]
MNNQFSSLFQNKTRVYAILVLIPFCLYFKSLFFDFSPMDDQWMIMKNSDILSDWKNIKTFFTKPLSGLYYRPLFSLSIMLDFHIGKASPFIYHFSNLIYHLISVVLFFKLLLHLKVTEQTSFLLALIFSVHPAVLHAVAWIPGRNDILLAIFVLSSSLYLIKFLTGHKKIHLIFHFLFFICALLTKENAIVLPAVFLLFIYYFKQPKKAYVLCFIVWLITLAGWYLLRSLAVKSSLSLGADVLISLKNFIMGLLLYIGKSIMPIQQSVFPTLKNSSILYGIIALAIISLAVFKIGLKNKALAVLGLAIFFSSILIPVWYGATGGSGEHYEQRIYLPLIGILLFISQLNFNQNSPLFTYSACLIMLVFSLKTFFRMNVYKSEISFIDAGLKEAPDFYFFQAVKGDKLLEQQNYVASIPYYDAAIKMQPRRHQLYSSRGYAYVELGKKTESIADFTKAIEIEKNIPDLYLNRCLTYKKFGGYEEATKDLAYLKKNSPQTIPEGLEKDLFDQLYNSLQEKINNQIVSYPNNALLYVRRAKLLLSVNKPSEALQDLKHACEIEPNNSVYKTYYEQLSSRMN